MRDDVRQGEEKPHDCDLCGLPVGAEPWLLSTPERRYAFCCEGCLGIFQLLHGLEAATVSTPSPR